MSSNDDFTHIRIDRGVTNQLTAVVQNNTSLTPNYIARVGLCYSLREPRPPSPEEYDSEGKEFNRYTLLGEHDALYIALVKQRLIDRGLDPDEEMYPYLVAHVNRGIERLSGRVGSLSDFYDLLPGELKPEA